MVSVDALLAVTRPTTVGSRTKTAVAEIECPDWVPATTATRPALTSDLEPFPDPVRYTVDPPTVTVHETPSRSLIVNPDALTADTVPATWGTTTSIALIVKVPSLFRVCRRRIASPTLRSPAAAAAPPFMIVVDGVTVIVRVHPSSVLSAIRDPSIAVIVMWPIMPPV